jgi:hypothetical protein
MIDFPLPDRDQAWLYAVTLTHDNKYDFPNTISRFVNNKLIITPVDLYTNEPITVTPWRDTNDRTSSTTKRTHEL